MYISLLWLIFPGQLNDKVLHAILKFVDVLGPIYIIPPCRDISPTRDISSSWETPATHRSTYNFHFALGFSWDFHPGMFSFRLGMAGYPV